MAHRPSPLVLLLLATAAGCADPSRLDAVEAGLARVRAEGALRDQKLEWLRWAQSVVAERTGPGGDAHVKQIAALQAENAALAHRLERAERRLDAAPPAGDGQRPASPPALSSSASRSAHTRSLDQRVPYEIASRPIGDRDGASAQLPGHLDVRLAAPRRALDETVPY